MTAHLCQLLATLQRKTINSHNHEATSYLNLQHEVQWNKRNHIVVLVTTIILFIIVLSLTHAGFLFRENEWMKRKWTQMNPIPHHPTHTNPHTLLNDVNFQRRLMKRANYSAILSLCFPHHGSQQVGYDGRLMEQHDETASLSPWCIPKTAWSFQDHHWENTRKRGTKWCTPPMARRKDKACYSEPLFPKWAPITIIILITTQNSELHFKWRFCTYSTRMEWQKFGKNFCGFKGQNEYIFLIY